MQKGRDWSEEGVSEDCGTSERNRRGCVFLPNSKPCIGAVAEGVSISKQGCSHDQSVKSSQSVNDNGDLAIPDGVGVDMSVVVPDL